MRSVILVCDDEPLVLGVLVAFLRHLGCEAIETENLASARREWAAQSHRINLVLIDHKLPDGHGVDFAREIVGQETGVPVALMSGFTVHELNLPSELHAKLQFLMKPFTLDQLTRLIAESLPQTASPAA